MANECELLGVIREYTDDWVYPHNDAVLASLPVEDVDPPLARPMFTVTGTGARSGLREGRRILLAGSINYLDDNLEEWIEKVEGVLRRLSFWTADVYLHLGWCGPARIHYRTRHPADAVPGTVTFPPRPPVELVTWCYHLPIDMLSKNETVLRVMRKRPGFLPKPSA